MKITHEEYINALRNGDLELVKRALKQNPSWIEEKDLRGSSPIILSSYYDNDEIVKYLIEMGANIESHDNAGNTALMGACFKGYQQLVNILLESGADVNAQNYNGATALAYSCMFNQQEIAETLLNHGADPYLKDSTNTSPAEHAKRQGLYVISKWMEKKASA